MSYDFVMDSYAWIEYFLGGSERDSLARFYIEKENSTTPTIAIAEISGKLLNENLAGGETKQGRDNKLNFIKASTLIVELTAEIARVAGEIDVERRKKREGAGIADSIILATARRKMQKL